MSIHYCTQSVWLCDLALCMAFLVPWFRISLQKVPFYPWPYHVLANYWKSAYYFIFHQDKLFYFCGNYDILYRFSFYTWIIQLVYSQFNCLHNCLFLFTITNNLISTKLHPNYYLFVSVASTQQMGNN